jgi:hypothetical protein
MMSNGWMLPLLFSEGTLNRGRLREKGRTMPHLSLKESYMGKKGGEQSCQQLMPTSMPT